MLFRGIFVEDPRNIICTKLQNIWFLKFQPIRKKNYPWHQKNKFQIKPVSLSVQIHFIFKDNVLILCLSGNVKNSKTPAKLSVNN